MNNDLPLTAERNQRPQKDQTIDIDGGIAGIYGSQVIFNSPKDKVNRFNRKSKDKLDGTERPRDKLEVLIPNEKSSKIKIAKLDTVEVSNDGKTKDMDSSVDFGPIETDQDIT